MFESREKNGNKKRVYRPFFIPLLLILLTGSCGSTDAADTATDHETVDLTADTKADDKTELLIYPPSGCYEEGTEITVSIKDGKIKDPQIWYTTDGSDPLLSDSKMLYEGSLYIRDRSGDENRASAVEPFLITPECLEAAEDGSGFVTDAKAPADEDVDKCFIIRAAVSGKGGESAYKSAVYYTGDMDEHIEGLTESVTAAGRDLIVMNIQTDEDGLFDHEKGIYVRGQVFEDKVNEFLSEGTSYEAMLKTYVNFWPANYNMRGKDWERKSSVTVLSVSADGSVTEILSQEAGLRTQGQSSRAGLQKGLRLYARKEYGKGSFEYPFFGEDFVSVSGETIDKFDTLILRPCQSGPCFMAKCEDMLLQDMLYEREFGRVALQKGRAAIVYLNGEYWGLYGLYSDLSSDYFKDVYGVPEDKLILYKAEDGKEGKLDEGKLPEGVDDQLYYARELYDFFDTHEDLSSDEDYAAFTALVEPDSFCAYFAAESWLSNNDWPKHNWTMWKSSEKLDDGYSDGRFRMSMNDLDHCGGWADRDTIADTGDIEGGLLNRESTVLPVRCFAYLMSNEGFKESFKAELLALSAESFEPGRADSYFGYYENVWGPLWEQHYRRYPFLRDASEDGYYQLEKLKQYVYDRPVYIWPIQAGL